MQKGLLFILIEWIVLFFLIVLILILIRQRRIAKYEKRFRSFSLTKDNDTTSSIFDLLYVAFWKIVHIISDILNKIPLINKMNKFYDNLVNRFKPIRNGLDVIVLKLIVSCGLCIICLAWKFPILNKLGIISYVILFIIGFMLPDLVFNIILERKKRKVEEELNYSIMILNQYLEKNNSIVQSLKLTIEKLQNPVKEEFEQIYKDVSYGVSIVDAFNRFYERLHSKKIKEIIFMLEFSLKENYSIKDAFKELEEKREKINELSSNNIELVKKIRRLKQAIGIIPLIIFIILYKLQGNYFELLFTTSFGRLIVLLIVLSYVMFLLLLIHFEVEE